jgi:hypothetical protein
MQVPATPSEGGFVGFFADNGAHVLKLWASLQDKSAVMAAEAAKAEAAQPEPKKAKGGKVGAKAAAEEPAGALLVGG